MDGWVDGRMAEQIGGWVDFKLHFWLQRLKTGLKHNPSLTSYKSYPLQFCESIKVSVYLLKDKRFPIHSDHTQLVTKPKFQAPSPHPDPKQATPLSSKPQNWG